MSAGNTDVPTRVGDAVPIASAAEESFEARYERMQRAKEEKAKAEKQRARELEVEEAELAERFERELGPRGKGFEIVVSKWDGCIVLRRGEEVLYKRFMAIINGTKPATAEDYYHYVAPTVVHPDRFTFDKICAERPHTTQRCANAQLTLQGFAAKEEQGKY